MAYKKEIEQCENDIAALQENRKKLKEKQEKEKLPNIVGIELITNGAMIEYLRNKSTTTYFAVSVCEHKGTTLLRIPLPNANIRWTFVAFDYIKDFCKVFSYLSYVYPVHKSCTPNDNYLYIKLNG